MQTSLINRCNALFEGLDELVACQRMEMFSLDRAGFTMRVRVQKSDYSRTFLHYLLEE